MQAGDEGHQRLFQAFSRQGANEVLVASVARWEEHERRRIILKQTSQELCHATEQISERQNCWLPRWRERRLCKRMLRRNSRADFSGNQGYSEEQRFNEELDFVEKKHRLGRLKKEREQREKRCLR